MIYIKLKFVYNDLGLIYKFLDNKLNTKLYYNLKKNRKIKFIKFLNRYLVYIFYNNLKYRCIIAC